MDEIVVGSVYLAGYLAPFCAFLWATRRPGATVASVLRASTFVGTAGIAARLLGHWWSRRL